MKAEVQFAAMHSGTLLGFSGPDADGLVWLHIENVAGCASFSASSDSIRGRVLQRSITNEAAEASNVRSVRGKATEVQAESASKVKDAGGQ